MAEKENSNPGNKIDMEINPRTPKGSSSIKNKSQRSQGAEIERKCLTSKSSDSQLLSQQLSQQIANAIQDIQNIKERISKNAHERQQIKERNKNKKYSTPSQNIKMIKNQLQISELKEKIQIKKDLIKLMQNQQKRIQQNRRMSGEQKQQIYQNISKTKDCWNRIYSQIQQIHLVKNKFEYEKENKGIDEKMTKIMQNLQNELTNIKFDDQKLSLQKRYQIRLTQFRIKNEKQLELLENNDKQNILLQLNRQIQKKQRNFNLLQVQYKQRLQILAQQHEVNLKSLRQKYYDKNDLTQAYEAELNDLGKQYQHAQLKNQQDCQHEMENLKEQKQNKDIDMKKQLKQQRKFNQNQLNQYIMKYIFQQGIYTQEDKRQMEEESKRLTQLNHQITQIDIKLKSQKFYPIWQLEGEMQKKKKEKEFLDYRIKSLQQKENRILQKKKKKFQYGNRKNQQLLTIQERKAYKQLEADFQTDKAQIQGKYQKKRLQLINQYSKRRQNLKADYQKKLNKINKSCQTEFKQKEMDCQDEYKEKIYLLQKNKNDCQNECKEKIYILQKKKIACQNEYRNQIKAAQKLKTDLEKYKKYQPQLKKYIYKKNLLKVQMKKQLEMIHKSYDQNNQRTKEDYEIEMNRLMLCFQQKQVQKSRYYNYNNNKERQTLRKWQQELQKLEQINLKQKEQHKNRFISEEDLNDLKKLQTQYKSLQLQEEKIKEHQNGLKNRQKDKFQFKKKTNSNKLVKYTYNNTEKIGQRLTKKLQQ